MEIPSSILSPRIRRLTLPHGGLRVPERKLLLAFVDLALFNGALLLTQIVRGHIPTTQTGTWAQLPWFFVLSVLWAIIGLVFDVYNLSTAARRLRSLWVTGGAAALTSAAGLLILHLAPAFPERGPRLLLFPVLAICGIGAWRVVYATIFVQPVFRHTVLIVGAGLAGRTLVRDLNKTVRRAPNAGQAIDDVGIANDASSATCPATGYCVLGFIDDDPVFRGSQVEGVPVLGGRSDLVHLAHVLQPDELVVAISNLSRAHGELFQAILDCWEMGIRVRTMHEFYERKTGRVPIEYVGHNLALILPVDRGAGYRLYLAVWRAFEFLVAALGCAATGLVAPLIWLANRLTDPGDLFYRQERVGKQGKAFQIVKFRSMIMDAEKHSGATWAEEDDPRITPVGRFLRKTRLDELPQFWNVLVGGMSLIGPRPERPEFVCELSRQIPFYGVRHAVTPGLTGWAQVQYRYGASVEDALVKLQYDLYYIKHRKPYLDLRILLKTVQVVFRMQGH
jgi:exopolysaccharide biosynthesis polyprenyl glycosylphosphotransferase